VIFVGGEASACGHAELGDVEVVFCDGLPPEALGLARWKRWRRGRARSRRRLRRERLRLLAISRYNRKWRLLQQLAVVVDAVDGDERGGIADRRSAQEELADDGEDGAVGSDAETDGEEDDEDEARGERERRRRGVAEVTPNALGPGTPALRSKPYV